MSILRYFITSKAKRSLLKLFFSHIDSPFYTREVARLTGEPLNAVRRELGYLEKAGLLHSYMQGNLKYYAIVKDYPVLAEWQKIILSTPNVETPGTARSTATRQSPEEPVIAADVIARNEVVKQSPEETGQPVVPPQEPIVASSAAAGQLPQEPVIVRNEVVKQSPEETGQPVVPPHEPVTASSAAAGQPPEETPLQRAISHLKRAFQDVPSVNMSLIHGETARTEDIPAAGIDLLVVSDGNRDDLLALVAGIEDETGIKINLTSMSRSDFDYRNARGDPLIRRIWSEKKLVVKGRH